MAHFRGPCRTQIIKVIYYIFKYKECDRGYLNYQILSILYALIIIFYTGPLIRRTLIIYIKKS